MIESFIRLRMSASDGHYAGNLVDGARILQLFGDAVTEVLIRNDGDEGLMRVLTSEFLVPVRCGDYIEVRAVLASTGRTSRRVECTAHKTIELVEGGTSRARILPEPLLVAKALAIAVVPHVDKSNAD